LEARAKALLSASSDLAGFTAIAGKLAESNSQLAKVFGPELLRIAQQTIADAGRAEQNIVSFQQDLATSLRALSLPAIFLPGGGIAASALLTAAAGGIEANTPLTNAEYQNGDPTTAQKAYQQGLVKAVGDGVTAFALGTAASKITPFLTHNLSLPLFQRGVPLAKEIASTIANGVVGGATTFGFQQSAEVYAGVTDPEIGSRTAGSAVINGLVSGIATSSLGVGAKFGLGALTVAGVTYQQGKTGQDLLNKFLQNGICIKIAKASKGDFIFRYFNRC
jgi:hypothetical protein